MSTTTIIGIAVVAVILIGIAFVVMRSPSATGALGGFLPTAEPPRDNTASDARDVMEGVASLIGSVGQAVGSIYGGATAAAAGGTSPAGAYK